MACAGESSAGVDSSVIAQATANDGSSSQGFQGIYGGGAGGGAQPTGGDGSTPADTSTPLTGNADDGSSGPPGGTCVGACGTCGTCPDSMTIDVDGVFSIDAFEVTKGEYALFMDADIRLDEQPSYCDWNVAYRPVSEWPPQEGDQDFPVVFVDWCDAYAYCKWAGKQLCGSLGGGPGVYANAADPAVSQWYYACSNGGRQVFPYGNVFSDTSCNGEGQAGSATFPTGSLATCEGGIGGVFDMSGNVFEWTDECNASDDRQNLCRRRGGGFFSEESLLRCGGAAAKSRDYVSESLGFRCCSIGA